MRYKGESLVMDDTSITDALATVRVDDLPDPEPACPVRLSGASPLVERMWRIALADIEANIVTDQGVRYFGAGRHFGSIVYTRDIAISGVFGLNELYPRIMRNSLEHTRKVRARLGFTVPENEVPAGLDIPWVADKLDNRAFLRKHQTNGYVRRTDDVIWLWAAADLFDRDAVTREDWRWLHDTGSRFFDVFYAPFYDEADGLYMGQSLFVDIGSAYGEDLSPPDCLGSRPRAPTRSMFAACR